MSFFKKRNTIVLGEIRSNHLGNKAIVEFGHDEVISETKCLNEERGILKMFVINLDVLLVEILEEKGRYRNRYP
jgi:hypothetical protein